MDRVAWPRYWATSSCVTYVACLTQMQMFECYATYVSNLELALSTYNQLLKHRSFREYIEVRLPSYPAYAALDDAAR